MRQQRPLGGQAAGVARQAAVRADDAVAGDDDRELIAAVGASDRARAAAELAGECAVGGRLAVRNLLEARPERSLERRPVLVEREVEAGAPAREVLVELASGLGQDTRFGRPRLPVGAGEQPRQAVAFGLGV